MGPHLENIKVAGQMLGRIVPGDDLPLDHPRVIQRRRYEVASRLLRVVVVEAHDVLCRKVQSHQIPTLQHGYIVKESDHCLSLSTKYNNSFV